MSYNKYYPAIQDDESGHFYPTFTEDSCDIVVDITELSAEFQADFASIMTNHTNSIYTGTDLTGTGTNIPYVIPSSLGGDLYVNVQTWNVYKAVATSLWDYVGNIKGAKGDTGSTGATGNGISSAVLNGDYTLTLNFTDGTSYTTTSIRGAQGETGETGATGNGISSIVQNADNTLTITMTDGTTYTTSPVKGDKGDTGTAATIAVGTVTKGENASVTNTGTSSAAVFDFTLPKGDKGDTGSTGATGNGIASITKTGTVGLVDTYTITFTNGTTTTFTVTNGEDGAGQVESVNGKTGVVVLDADDVGALPDNTSIPSKTSDLTNDSGFITTETDPTVPSWAKASTKPTYTAQEVGALPSSTSIPSKTSDLTNDSGYITSAQAPVTSVNGMTGDVTVVSGVTSVNGQSGAVVLDADDVGALPDDTSIPSATSDLTNDSGFVSSQQTEKIFVQGTTPSTASDGDIWIDTATQSASGVAYLPLSAGSSHHITGDLYVDEDIIDANGDTFVADSNYVHTDNNYTTTEKDKLSVIGTYTKYEDTTTHTISVNTFTSLYSFTKPANATYGITTCRIGYSLTDGAGTSRLSVGNQSIDVYAQDQYFKYAQVTGIVENGKFFAVTPKYREMTITSILIETLWF